MVFGRSLRRPTTNRGERIYAIGDVHGRLDLLRELLVELEAHDASLPAPKNRHILLLGDLVDRGPDSAGVVEFVFNAARKSDRIIVLQGNHESMMLQALDGAPGVLRAWLRTGGRETLKSFGIEPDDFPSDSELVAQANKVIPQAHLDWLRSLPLTAQSGDYFFCHAGVRPGVPLRKQAPVDLLWIRDEFLKAEQAHGAVVVHGHSVKATVEFHANRIGIDTGAYRTGVLTAIFLEGSSRKIMSTGQVSRAA
jgi:serine/threonine protein phosphatase 1